jgi:hypothetical protein
MKTFWAIVGVIVFICAISIVITMCGRAASMVNNGVETAYQEFKPSELLRKYEWFKDAAAQLDQKLATLKTYESRFQSIKNSYGADSINRKNWDRTDKDQWNVWESEFLGIKASYNSLCAEYNAAMAKFNYAFTNIGSLPQGATEALPRQFKPYLTN